MQLSRPIREITLSPKLIALLGVHMNYLHCECYRDIDWREERFRLGYGPTCLSTNTSQGLVHLMMELTRTIEKGAVTGCILHRTGLQ